jgi:hypothetical protein
MTRLLRVSFLLPVRSSRMWLQTFFGLTECFGGQPTARTAPDLGESERRDATRPVFLRFAPERGRLSRLHKLLLPAFALEAVSRLL